MAWRSRVAISARVSVVEARPGVDEDRITASKPFRFDLATTPRPYSGRPSRVPASSGERCRRSARCRDVPVRHVPKGSCDGTWRSCMTSTIFE
jgi:hypothetical protein